MSQEYSRQDMDENYRSGVAAGKRIAMDEMSAKSAEGFMEWWDSHIHADTFTQASKEAWQAGRAPLLAKIAELEAQCEELSQTYAVALDSNINLSAKITDLEAQNKQLKEFWKPIIKKFESKYPNAGNANTVALTALTEAFDIHCKNETLEAQNKKLAQESHEALQCVADLATQNKKLGDVVLEMEDHLVGLAEEVLLITEEAAESPHVIAAMKIKQLKQERE